METGDHTTHERVENLETLKRFDAALRDAVVNQVGYLRDIYNEVKERLVFYVFFFFLEKKEK